MGIFDVYCLACGGPCSVPAKFKFAKWCNSWVVVTEEGVVQVDQYDNYGRFRNRKNHREFVKAFRDDDGTPGGFGFHKACWEIVGRPKYDDLRHIKRRVYSNDSQKASYPLRYAQGQLFEFEKVKPSDMFRLENPLKNSKNRESIQKLFIKILNL